MAQLKCRTCGDWNPIPESKAKWQQYEAAGRLTWDASDAMTNLYPPSVLMFNGVGVAVRSFSFWLPVGAVAAWCAAKYPQYAAIAAAVAIGAYTLIVGWVTHDPAQLVPVDETSRPVAQPEPAPMPEPKTWEDSGPGWMKFYSPPRRKSGRPIEPARIEYVARCVVGGAPFSERAIAKTGLISGPDFRLLQDDFIYYGFAKKHTDNTVELTPVGRSMIRRIAGDPPAPRRGA